MPGPLPPRESRELVNTGIRVSKALLDRLSEIADRESYSRNEVIERFLVWALKAYDEDKSAEAKKPKR